MNSPTNQNEKYAVLKLPDGREHKIKIYNGTIGSDSFLDIRDLYSKTGCLVSCIVQTSSLNTVSFKVKFDFKNFLASVTYPSTSI